MHEPLSSPKAPSVPGALTPDAPDLGALWREIDALESIGPAQWREALRRTLDKACVCLGASGAVIERLDGEDLVYAITTSSLVAREGFRLRLAGSFSGLTLRSEALQYCEDSELDHRVDRAACRAMGLRSMICAPMAVGEERYVLKVISPARAGFEGDQLSSMRTLSQRLSRRLRPGAQEARQPPAADVARTQAPDPATPSRPETRVAVASSKQVLQAVERAAMVGWWTMDPASLDMRWSDGLHRLLGTDPHSYTPCIDDLLGWTLTSDRRALQLLLDGSPAASTALVRVRAADGVLRWLRFQREPSHPGDVSQLGLALDISALQSAQQAVDAHHAAFETLSALCDGMIWRATPDGSLSFELGWGQYTGTTLAQNRGDGWGEQIHPDDRSAAILEWRQAQAHRTPYFARFRVKRHDGVFELFDSRALPLGDAAGDALEWLGITVPVGANVGMAQTSATANPELPTPRELKAMRALLDWSVQDLSGACGVSASTITRYENSDGAARPASLERLAETLASRGVRIERVGERRLIGQA